MKKTPYNGQGAGSLFHIGFSKSGFLFLFQMKNIIYQCNEEKTDSENLYDFLSIKNLLDKRVIIEINNTILKKSTDLKNIKINNNDIINIFLIVPGG